MKNYKNIGKTIEIKDCPVLWPPSRPEFFDPTAHKVWDGMIPPGGSDSLRDTRLCKVVKKWKIGNSQKHKSVFIKFKMVLIFLNQHPQIIQNRLLLQSPVCNLAVGQCNGQDKSNCQ